MGPKQKSMEAEGEDLIEVEKEGVEKKRKVGETQEHLISVEGVTTSFV